MKYPPFFFLLLILLACNPSPELPKDSSPDAAGASTQPQGLDTKSAQAISLFGDTLYSPAPSDALLARYEKRRQDYLEDSTKVDNIIWYGRFTAYLGQYQEAIDIYTRGIDRHPEEARLYRHRGHRYITIRKFDEAIKDLQYAAVLVAGTENQIEPDGMPNARNIPVSTLHGNIYYHLGLAHYLKNEMPEALAAYQKCLASSGNNDNLVFSTHWLYMIARRMGDEALANSFLESIQEDLDVIENMAYHRACLFYKGILPEEGLLNEQGEAPANDALAYALANWHYYNGQTEKAHESYEKILAQDSWNSFGYLAAEADVFNLGLR